MTSTTPDDLVVVARLALDALAAAGRGRGDEWAPGQISVCLTLPVGREPMLEILRSYVDPDGDLDLCRCAGVAGRRWRREWEHADCETPADVGPWSAPYTGRGWRERLARDVAEYAIAAVGAR